MGLVCFVLEAQKLQSLFIVIAWKSATSKVFGISTKENKSYMDMDKHMDKAD